MKLQKLNIKLTNESLLRQHGYRINDWLPTLDVTSLRHVDEIKGRMSIMTALLNIAFGAPITIISHWIDNNNLRKYLSNSEILILQKDNKQLTPQQLNDLKWYLESLWAFMWLTGMIAKLLPEKPVSDNMASLLPNLKNGENDEKIKKINNTQSTDTAYQMLDYYYRLHWYCIDGRLNKQQVKLNEGLIYQRRKALEWAFTPTADWDDVEMGT